MKRFIVDGQYGKFLTSFGIRVEEALKKAGVAEDIFSHKAPTMTITEYFCFMEAIGTLVREPDIPIQIASADNIESFSPPIFAAYCSRNAKNCIKRLGRYKSLIGPLRYVIEETGDQMKVEIVAEDGTILPEFLAKTELVFLVNIIRRATKEEIIPQSVAINEKAVSGALKEFFKCSVLDSEKVSIIFSKTDMEIPFISQNDAMWDYFEPELKRRLFELEIDASFSARVRSALTELLPGGCSSIDGVAEKMGISRRTLQRKLQDENTNFQKQLNHTRELLAINYLKNTDMSSNDIAFLLGYQELNSFLKAFNIWTGMSITEYKQKNERQNPSL